MREKIGQAASNFGGLSIERAINADCPRHLGMMCD
jgi:hypothetical protein